MTSRSLPDRLPLSERAERRAWSALMLLLVAAPAQAQSTVAVVAPLLAALGAAGGLIAGAVAGWRGHPRAALWPGFGVYLGLLSMLASTRAGTLDIVPLALVLGAAAGIVPFALAWLAVRRAVLAVRGRLQRAR